MKAICLELMRHTEHREVPIVMNFLISSANELAYMLAMKLLDVSGWGCCVKLVDVVDSRVGTWAGIPLCRGFDMPRPA